MRVRALLGGALCGGAMVAVLAGAPPAAAQDATGPPAFDSGPPVRVHLVPDPIPMGAPDPTVGDAVWVTVITRGPRGWALLPGSLEGVYAGRPEAAVLETDRRDGRVRLRLAVFRPGDVVLPEGRARVLTAMGDTLTVPVTADTIRVSSVLAPGDTVLAEIKPLWREREVPPWVWLAAAAALALVLAGMILWRRRRDRPEPAAARAVAARDPYGEARARIEALAREPGVPPETITTAAGIGDALRGYLAEGWGLPARERTTLETLSLLPGGPDVPRGALGSALGVADEAKFARVAPLPAEVGELAERALDALDRMESARRGRIAAAAEAAEGETREAAS